MGSGLVLFWVLLFHLFGQSAIIISIGIIVVPGVSLFLIKGNGMHVVVDHQLRYYIL